jgi:hypothetical protein
MVAHVVHRGWIRIVEDVRVAVRRTSRDGRKGAWRPGAEDDSEAEEEPKQGNAVQRSHGCRSLAVRSSQPGDNAFRMQASASPGSRIVAAPLD